MKQEDIMRNEHAVVNLNVDMLYLLAIFSFGMEEITSVAFFFTKNISLQQHVLIYIFVILCRVIVINELSLSCIH